MAQMFASDPDVQADGLWQLVWMQAMQIQSLVSLVQQVVSYQFQFGTCPSQVTHVPWAPMQTSPPSTFHEQESGGNECTIPNSCDDYSPSAREGDLLGTSTRDRKRKRIRTSKWVVGEMARVCRRYARSGVCKFGTQCTFHHIESCDENNVVEVNSVANELSSPALGLDDITDLDFDGLRVSDETMKSFASTISNSSKVKVDLPLSFGLQALSGEESDGNADFEESVLPSQTNKDNRWIAEEAPGLLTQNEEDTNEDKSICCDAMEKFDVAEGLVVDEPKSLCAPVFESGNAVVGESVAAVARGGTPCSSVSFVAGDSAAQHQSTGRQDDVDAEQVGPVWAPGTLEDCRNMQKDDAVINLHLNKVCTVETIDTVLQDLGRYFGDRKCNLANFLAMKFGFRTGGWDDLVATVVEEANACLQWEQGVSVGEVLIQLRRKSSNQVQIKNTPKERTDKLTGSRRKKAKKSK